MSGQGGAGRREVAWRVFAAEYDDATLEHSDSDEERAPNYVVTPTGARVNRLFVVGVLTEVEQVSDEVLRGRVVDPTGGFVVYAGQYQPDAMAFLERADPPAFVAVTGKARTFRPDDSDAVYTSVRPESINEVDAETRDRWTVQTAEQTLQRVRTFAGALESVERGDDLRRSLEASDVDAGLAAGIPLALDHYGTTPAYLAAVHDLALDAARVVAGEIDADEVGPLSTAPDESGDVAVDLTADAPDVTAVSGVEPESTEEPAPVGAEETGTDVDAEESEAFESGPEERDETAGTDEDVGIDGTADVVDTEEEAASDPVGGDETADADRGDDSADISDGVETDESAPEVEDASDAAELEAETEGEPTVAQEQEAVSDEEFEPEVDAETEPGTGETADEMYEFDDGERERIEEEYGTEFSTATEVDDPGEADIDTPAPEGEEASEATEREADRSADDPGEFDAGDELGDFESGGAATADEAEQSEPAEGATEESEAVEAATDDEGTGDESAGDEPEDLENTVMRVMQDLNGDDGVEQEQLLAAVVNRYDVAPADVEDALQDALMAGRCYESGEDTLKPI
jgi:RPA family protein